MASKAKAKQSKVSFLMGEPDEKKRVVKFVADEDSPVGNLYFDKKTWTEMGSPTDIEVTIEVTD